MTCALTYVVKRTSLTKEAVIIFGASLLIALSAFIAIPLPFTPVPITMQSGMVLFLAALLGSRRASLAVIAYLFEGAMGFPVFAMGKAGIAVLAGPTGGYLLGYILAAYLTGYFLERMREQNIAKTACVLAFGNLAIYACGLSWLSIFVGIKPAFFLGVLPFLAGDSIKLILTLKGLRALKAV